MVITESANRIVAKDVEGREICGAFKRNDEWQLYVTVRVANLTGLATPPHREHFYEPHAKRYARQWVQLIATLYQKATEESTQ